MEAAVSTPETDVEKQQQEGIDAQKMGAELQKSRSHEGSSENIRKRQKLHEKTDHASIVVSEDKGSRLTMEDSAVILVDARLDPLLKQRVSFFGVFDGHGGCNTAKMACEILHNKVMKAGLVEHEVASGVKELSLKSATKCIVEGFHEADKDILSESEVNSWQDGCAAVGVWAVGEKIVVANVGDAKCVLARVSIKEESKGQLKGLVLTKEHLAIYPKERSRIERNGSFVSNDGRLDGRLQVSRSLGDGQLKKGGLIATPDVQGFTITDRDKFMICGCDGFWKVFDSQDAVSTTSALLSEGRELKAISNRLINMAVRERRCTDNCTVMVINFVHQKNSSSDGGHK